MTMSALVCHLRPIAARAALSVLALCTAAPLGRVQEEPPAPLEERASELAALFVAKPKLREGLFHPGFLEQVPAAQMIGIFKSYHRQGGACSGAELVSRDSPWSGRFRLRFEKGVETLMTLSVEPAEPHAVVGLFLTSLEPSLAGFPELEAELAKLPGRAGLAVARLGAEEPEPVFQFRGDEVFAIGSTFKLYILGALVEEVAAGARGWSEVLELEERHRSLPSGFLTDWPAGAPLTLHTLAALMISQSDNTATDHLLFALGRERVEAMLEPMGNGAPAGNRPFLSTAEMFRLKGFSGGKHAGRYLALPTEERRAYLAGEVASLPLADVSSGALLVPTHIDEIEWFASCDDLCRAMDWLRRHTAEGEALRAREILAINGGLPAADRFRYAGYKGGSEGGVLNLTWLLEREDGAWYALSASWNDAEKALDEARFFGLVGRALGLVAEIGPPAESRR